MTHFGIPKKTEGNQREAVVSDDDVLEVLQRVLIELKMMNLHLAALSGEEITEADICN